jgi:putative endonuclease
MFEKLQQMISRWIDSSGFFSATKSSNTKGRPRLAEERLGLRGEKAAARFLRKKGYRILAHSHRQRLGEIDLIAVDRNCLVFVEVKTWRSDNQADPSEAVDRRKQERITRAALIYLKQHKLLEHPARFDVVSIVWPKTTPHGRRAKPSIRHFENAFDAVGNWQMFR